MSKKIINTVLMKPVIEQKIQERVLAESTAQLIMEVLDAEDLKKATRVLDRLTSIEKLALSDPNLKDSLGAAITDARNEVNDFTGGGMGSLLKKGATAIAKKFGAKAGKNPILKATMLLNALETGLKDAASVIKNNAPNFDEKSSQSLMKQLDDNGIKNVQKNLKKAFVPEGIFANLKSFFGASSGGMPYVSSVETLVDDIMMMPAQNLVKLIRIVTSNPISSEIQDTVKDMVGSTERSSTSGSESRPVTSLDSLATVVAAGRSAEKGSDSSVAVEKAKENPKALVKDFVKYVKDKSQQDEKTVTRVLSALIKKGKIRSSFSVAESVVKKTNIYTLAMKDVLDAQMALIHSKGSTRQWVKNLLEMEVPEEVKGALQNNKDGKEFIKKIEKDESPAEGEVIALKNIVKNLKLSKEPDNLNKEIDAIVDKVKKSGEENKKKLVFKKKVEDSKSIEDIVDILDEMDPDGKKTIGDMSVDFIIKILNHAESNFTSSKSSKDKKEAIRGLKKIPSEIDFVKIKATDLLVNSSKESGKHSNLIKSIQDDLEGIDVKSIESILDVLPDYLKLEAKKQIKSVI